MGRTPAPSRISQLALDLCHYEPLHAWYTAQVLALLLSGLVHNDCRSFNSFDRRDKNMDKDIDLTYIKGSQGTAFLTLKPKAYYMEFVPKEEQALDFSKSAEICERVGIDFSDYVGDSETKKRILSIGFVIRSKAFEELLDKYIKQLDNPVVVHFGCGLSDRSERYRQRGFPFYDVDFPDMIELRKNFYEDGEHYKMIGSDLSTYTWIEQIPQEQRQRPFIFIAEGVSPYLREMQLKELFAKLKENFPGCVFIFDTYTELKLKQGKKEVEKFGAEFHFYNKDPSVMVNWGEGEYQSLEEDNLSYRKDFLKNKYLPGFYKFMIRVVLACFFWHKGLTRSTVIHVFQFGQKT